MDVRRLELLRELAARGSVGAVAAATNRTPSAVSQQLKVLEREIGTPLTERQGRGVILTEAGRALARTAEDIAVAMERAEALWSEYMGTPSGEVSLSLFPTGGQMFLPGLLDRLASHPGIRLRADDHDPALDGFVDLTHNYDVVLAHSPHGARDWRGSRLHIQELMTEPLDVALPTGHRLTAKEVLRPVDLAGEPWIGVPLDKPFQQVLEGIEDATGEPPRVVQRFSDNRIVEALVSAGHGLAILPRFTSGPANGVELRPLRGVTAERHISVLSRPDRFERPSVRLVFDVLEKIAADIVQTG